jgi:endonuclease-3
LIKYAMSGRKNRGRKQEFIVWCDRSLAREYGDKARPKRRTPPLAELVLTVLSQNTNDRNRDRAFGELTRRFPSWEDVLAAPAESVEDAIRVGGLARQKSRRIQAMLHEIKRREGRLDLRRICRMSREDALSYLYSFKGVGRKTAAIVLLFSCGKPVFPVDTHIFRLSGRLGLLPEKSNPDKAHDVMDELVPDEIKYRFHINMIEHGRNICGARKPLCEDCCLSKKCPQAFRIDK